MGTHKIVDVISSRAFQVTAATVLSGSISAVVSHILTKRRLDRDYSDILAKEIAEAKRFYSAVNKRGDYSSPERVLSILETRTTPAFETGSPEYHKAVAAIKVYQGTPPVDETDDPYPVDEEINNVFGELAVDLTEEEIANRDKTKPYIINAEEFNEGPSGHIPHQQITLTYYDDDDVLADEQDLPVDDVQRTVGVDNLKCFGRGSNDPRVVYIRNERISVDFEVVLHKGNYGEIVHGVMPDERKTRKPRGGDE